MRGQYQYYLEHDLLHHPVEEEPVLGRRAVVQRQQQRVVQQRQEVRHRRGVVQLGPQDLPRHGVDIAQI